MPNGIPFDRINAAALANFASLLGDRFPAGVVHGREFKIGDVTGSPGQSCSINLSTGRWKDFADGSSGSDPISLFAAADHGGDQAAAARDLSRKLGVYLNGGAAPNIKKPTSRWVPMSPPIAAVPSPADLSWRGRKPDDIWSYRDAFGNLIVIMRRFNGRDGKKDFIPLSFGELDGVLGWHDKHQASPRPLYGLDQLAARPVAPVMLVEGEKAADAAAILFPGFVVMTWAGGAGSVRLGDYAAIDGRDVRVIWPDADKPGADAPAWLATRFPAARLLDVSDLPEGADAADVMPDDPEQWLREHLAPPSPPPKPAFIVLTPSEITAEQSRPYVVKGLIAGGDHIIAMGHPGSGKSVLAPYVAYAVAQGGKVLDRRVKGGPVIYLAAEDGAGMKNRVRALLKRHGDAPDFHLIPEALDLMNDSPGRKALAAMILRVQPVLIVVDTLSKSFPGLRENEGDDMGRMIRVVRDLSAICGSAVWSIHHVPKDAGTTPRGHGSLNADADLTMLIEGNGTEKRLVRLGKNRNGASDLRLAFNLEVAELGIDDDGDQITAPIAVEANDPVPARSALDDEAAVLLREIEAAIIDRLGERIEPEPNLGLCDTLTRIVLRKRLIDSDWLHTSNLSETSPSAVIPEAEYKRFNKRLMTLKRRGLIGFNAKMVWLSKKPTSPIPPSTSP